MKRSKPYSWPKPDTVKLTAILPYDIDAQPDRYPILCPTHLAECLSIGPIPTTHELVTMPCGLGCEACNDYEREAASNETSATPTYFCTRGDCVK